MRIYEKDELENLIVALQPDNEKYKFARNPSWAKDLDLGPESKRLLDWTIKTIEWCNEHANQSQPKESLRSIGINPFGFHESRYVYISKIQSTRSANFNWSNYSPNKTILNKIKKGRFLIYYPQINLADGAACVESGEFFDGDNIPAWDTWVDYFEDPSPKGLKFLITWIPEQFLDLADKGIWVNPEECIAWADKTDFIFNAIWNDLSHVLKAHFDN